MTSHPEQPLEVFLRLGCRGRSEQGFWQGGPTHLQVQHSVLIPHFFLSQCPLQAEKWLRKEEAAALLAAGLERICLVALGAGGSIPRFLFSWILCGMEADMASRAWQLLLGLRAGMP